MKLLLGLMVYLGGFIPMLVLIKSFIRTDFKKNKELKIQFVITLLLWTGIFWKYLY